MSIDTLSDLVFQVREISSGRPDLLSVFSGGRRENLSAADFLRNIHSLALALEARGLANGDRVAIFSENRPEWHIVDFACQLLGAPTVPICPALDRRQVGFIRRNSGSRWVFFSGADRLDLLRDLQPTLTSAPKLVALNGGDADGEASLTRWMGEGAARIGGVPIERFRGRVAEDDLASLIYTSGATGDPQGVMLSHRQLVSDMLACGESLDLSPADLAVALLPLSDRLQRTVDHLCFFRGAAIHYLPSATGTWSTLRREQPTVLAAVPAVYERAYRQTLKLSRRKGPLGRRIFAWALAVGKRHATNKRGGFVGPLLALQRRLADLLVLRGLRRRFGGRLRLPISGGAPLAPEVGDFLEAAGMAILQGYGLTETTVPEG